MRAARLTSPCVRPTAPRTPRSVHSTRRFHVRRFHFQRFHPRRRFRPQVQSADLRIVCALPPEMMAEFSRKLQGLARNDPERRFKNGWKDVTEIVRGMVHLGELHMNPTRARQWMDQHLWPESARGPAIPRKARLRLRDRKLRQAVAVVRCVCDICRSNASHHSSKVL